MVHDVEEDLAFVLKEAGAEIRVSDVALHADAEQLRTLLQNLIQNAVAYRRRDVPPRIQVTAEAVPEGVAVHVRDNGKGIPAEERSNVTEPLVRLHRADDPPGFGLGLATCVRIAQAHGGRLEISEAPGGGTNVSVILPVLGLPGSAPAAMPDGS